MTRTHIDTRGLSAGKLLAGLVAFDMVLMIVAVALGRHAGDSLEYLAEKEFITWVSVLQLLAVSWAAYSVFKVRYPKAGTLNWQNPYMIWAIIAFGFFYLAADELTMIHESFDNAIHYVFNLQETAVTDRIDDIIIGVYGLIGLGALYYYRGEIMKSKCLLPYLAGGFVLLFTTVVMDVLTNRDDIIALMVSHDAIETCHICLSIVEESLEMIAESIFFVGFIATRNAFRVSIPETAGTRMVSVNAERTVMAQSTGILTREH